MRQCCCHMVVVPHTASMMRHGTTVRCQLESLALPNGNISIHNHIWYITTRTQSLQSGNSLITRRDLISLPAPYPIPPYTKWPAVLTESHRNSDPSVCRSILNWHCGRDVLAIHKTCPFSSWSRARLDSPASQEVRVGHRPEIWPITHTDSEMYCFQAWPLHPPRRAFSFLTLRPHLWSPVLEKAGRATTWKEPGAIN